MYVFNINGSSSADDLSLEPKRRFDVSTLLPPLQVGRASALRGRQPPLGHRQQVPDVQQGCVRPLRLLPPASAVQESPGRRRQQAAPPRPLPLVWPQQLPGHRERVLSPEDQLMALERRPQHEGLPPGGMWAVGTKQTGQCEGKEGQIVGRREEEEEEEGAEGGEECDDSSGRKDESGGEVLIHRR